MKNVLPKRPLEGLRVLEVAVWHAGPGAAAMLGDLGAEVIKVESPGGDPQRSQLGSFVLKTWSVDQGNDWNVQFDVSNRNKKSLCVDLGTDAGKEAVRRLAATCDVFITNLRTSTKKKLGIDYETLSAENPRLIHVNITGFGPRGARADHGAFDTLGQAASGMMWTSAGESPVPLPSVTLDQMTAIQAANAAMTALYARERFGIGQDVHVSLLGTGIWAWHSWIAATSALGKLPDFSYDRRRKSPLLSIHRCKDDKWIVGTNPGKKQWPAFCEAIGRPDLIETGFDFDDFEGLERIYTEIDPVLATKTADEWIEIFAPLGVMFAPVDTFLDVLHDSQAAANGYMVDFEHPHLGDIRLPGFPIEFGKFEAGIRTSAPKLGEHSAEILASIGYSESEIEALTTRYVHPDARVDTPAPQENGIRP